MSTELAERTARSREMAREADLLRHGLAEIEAVDPQPGEDDELVAKARRLADADQLREAATGRVVRGHRLAGRRPGRAGRARHGRRRAAPAGVVGGSAAA